MKPCPLASLALLALGVATASAQGSQTTSAFASMTATVLPTVTATKLTDLTFGNILQGMKVTVDLCNAAAASFEISTSTTGMPIGVTITSTGLTDKLGDVLPVGSWFGSFGNASGCGADKNPIVLGQRYGFGSPGVSTGFPTNTFWFISATADATSGTVPAGSYNGSITLTVDFN